MGNRSNLFGFLACASEFTLAGYNFSLPKINIELGNDQQNDAVPIKDGKQVIRMDQVAHGYSPNKFVIKKGIPVVWKINSKDSYTCAAYFSVPALGINSPLKTGENVFEFTPEDAGNINFSCGMGMYRGVINVIN